MVFKNFFWLQMLIKSLGRLQNKTKYVEFQPVSGWSVIYDSIIYLPSLFPGISTQYLQAPHSIGCKLFNIYHKLMTTVLYRWIWIWGFGGHGEVLQGVDSK